MKTAFQTALIKAIEDYIREAKKDGTCGMGLNNLKQCVRPPYHMDGAPHGTNAQWVYSQMFEEAVTSSKIASKFIIG